MAFRKYGSPDFTQSEIVDPKKISDDISRQGFFILPEGVELTLSPKEETAPELDLKIIRTK